MVLGVLGGKDMTIQEAINHAREVADEKYKEGFLCYANSGNAENDKKNDEYVKCARDHEQLAEWLEELQQYKAIEIEMKEHYHANVDIKLLMQYFIETIFKDKKHEKFYILTNEDAKIWDEYQEIGTVEKCREARERQMAKKPILDDIYKINYYCPNCEEFLVGNIREKFPYCQYCGQAIDWSDTD